MDLSKFQNPKLQPLLETLPGRTKDEANDLIKASGFISRVVSEDGNRYFVTQELRFDRFNLEIENGFVTKVDLG